MKTLNRNVPLAVEQREQRAVRTSLEGSAAATSEGPNVALRRKGDIRLYALFIRPIGWIRMILYTLFTSLFAAGEIIPEIYIRIWIETNPDKTTYFVGYASIGAATCVFGCLVYWFLFVLLSPRSSSQLHQRLVNTTMGATLRFLSTTKSGIFLNRYSQDMTLLSGKLPVALLRTIHAGTNVLAQIGIILAGATYLGGALPIVLLAIYFIQKFYLRTSRQVRHLELEAQDPLHTYFTETATGLTHIRAFKCQQQNIQRGISLLEAAQKPFYVQLAIQQWLNMVLGLLSGILGISLVAMALFIDESSSSSSIGLAFIGLIWLSIALEHLMTAWTDLETSTGALARLSIFEEQTPQEVLRKSESLPSHWPSTGRIELMNVTASHIPEDPGAVPALRDISLSILPGQHISIVGRSGSGKSSLFSTLLGFVYYEGRIKIDGVDIASISLNDLRSRLVTITQDQVQFDATIRTNLLPLTMNDVPRKSDGRSDEKTAKQDMDLEQLLKSLHIWLPLTEKGGLDAMLEDVGYSKGQVQLLCIARAILKQRETGSRVVLVDEATSSVDLQTERIVNQVVRENFAGCTVLTIAHRPTSIDGADGSICLHHGRLVDPDRGFSESEPEEDESGPEADESGEGAT
ncbi:ABC multidrug transporter [Cordyceps javanica]|nr:ABC multidrug transporter [Cordyceps javanica]